MALSLNTLLLNYKIKKNYISIWIIIENRIGSLPLFVHRPTIIMEVNKFSPSMSVAIEKWKCVILSMHEIEIDVHVVEISWSLFPYENASHSTESNMGSYGIDCGGSRERWTWYLLLYGACRILECILIAKHVRMMAIILHQSQTH